MQRFRCCLSWMPICPAVKFMAHCTSGSDLVISRSRASMRASVLSGGVCPVHRSLAWWYQNKRRNTGDFACCQDSKSCIVFLLLVNWLANSQSVIWFFSLSSCVARPSARESANLHRNNQHNQSARSHGARNLRPADHHYALVRMIFTLLADGNQFYFQLRSSP